MAKWEFAVAIKDETDLASGHKRKKEGDIIAVRPYPWAWGKEEVKRFLIVVVDNLTEKEAETLCQPQFKDGKTLSDFNLLYLPKPITKRRYKLPLSILKEKENSIDLDKIKNKNLEYQPLKNTTFDANNDIITYDKYNKKDIKPIEVKISSNIMRD